MTDFTTTHTLTGPNGEAIHVHEADGALYTREEWKTTSTADWEMDAERGLLFQGQVRDGWSWHPAKPITIRDNTSGDVHHLDPSTPVRLLVSADQLERERERNSRSRHQTHALSEAIRDAGAEGGGVDEASAADGNSAGSTLADCAVGDWVLVESDMPGDEPGTVVWWVSEVIADEIES